jgi:hypothetical protein
MYKKNRTGALPRIANRVVMRTHRPAVKSIQAKSHVVLPQLLVKITALQTV